MEKTVNAHFDNSISVAKGIGISLMVVHHSGLSELSPAYESFFNIWVMTFFFLCPGLLFKETYFANPIKFVKRRIKNLYWPIVKYSLLFIGIHNLLCLVLSVDEGFTLQESVSKWVHMITHGDGYNLLGAYWFVWAMLYSSLIVFPILWLISLCGSRLKRYQFRATNPIICIALTLVFVALASFRDGLPFFPSRISAVTFMACAYFTAGIALKGIRTRLSAATALALIVFALIVRLMMNGPSAINSVGGLMCMPFFLMSVAFAMGALTLLEKIRGRMASMFSAIGRETLIILTFHFLAFKIVSAVICQFASLPASEIMQFPVVGDELNLFYVSLYTLAGVGLPMCYAYVRRYVVGRLSIEARA